MCTAKVSKEGGTLRFQTSNSLWLIYWAIVFGVCICNPALVFQLYNKQHKLEAELEARSQLGQLVFACMSLAPQLKNNVAVKLFILNKWNLVLETLS